MQNHEKFLCLYNELDDLLRKRYSQYDRTRSVIVNFIQDLERSGIRKYEEYGRKLDAIRLLRNNLIHDWNNNADHLIDITQDTLDFLSLLVERVRSPKTASDIATPLSKLVRIKEGDAFELESLLRTMRRNGYSQIPLLTSNDALLGVFSPNALFSYLCEHPSKNVKSITAEEVKEMSEFSRHFSESYVFVGPNYSEEAIADLFLEAYQANRKPTLAFVTSNGKIDGKVLGVMSLSDIVKE